MELQEVNKIIAEYMGLRFVKLCDNESYIQNDKYDTLPMYSQSLDALVPVWEKLEGRSSIIELVPMIRVSIIDATFSHVKTQKYKGETLQEAAAIVTAKAIVSLQEDLK